MTGPVRSIVFDLIGHDGVSSTFDRVASNAEKSASRMDAVGARMSKTGATMTKAFTAPVAAIAAFSVDQAAKFQKSMTLLQTAGGESVAKVAVISAGVKKLAVETGTSLEQLGDGIYVVAKAGGQKWSAVDQLNVLKAAAQGAKAENVPLATSVNALTSVMMSYHIAASKAVSVEDELIRGSGLAKTTMTEYAGSLSTVVPIASAAGIQFDQVAGAIATLTQHGTTADEATQELANTIRNLLQPNNVASQAIQQLGLNVVDVEKNLGTRGLTGTIDLLTNAIRSKMGPSGLVAVDSFKKSQSASADLNVEISKMPANLAALSKQFESGAIGYTAYRKEIRNLSSAQYEMGAQFLTTLGQAQGFNNLLKAGNPDAQTFAGYLKQIMGGATGLNTALQLGGENMAYFKSATDQVAAASKTANSNVLGWSQTQNTFAVKASQVREQLQVFAVDLGTQLLPVAAKLLQWAMDAVTWFQNLSEGWKKVIEIGAGVLAAIGPILVVGSKLISMYQGVARVFLAFVDSFKNGWANATGSAAAAQAQLAATNAEQQSSEARTVAAIAASEAQKAEAYAQSAVDIAAALEGTDSALAVSAEAAANNAREFSAAMRANADAAIATALQVETASAEQSAAIATSAGTSKLAIAGIGAAAGTMASQFTGHMSFAGKAAGALAATATGAIAGLAMGGGPFGAAVGGVTGLLSDLASAFFGVGTNAKNAIAPTSQFTDAIAQDNQTLGPNVRQLIAGQLASKGAFSAAKVFGIDPYTLTTGLMDGGSQMAAIQAKMQAAMNQPVNSSNPRATVDLINAYNLLQKLLPQITTEEQVNLQASRDIAAAQTAAGKNVTAHAQALKDLSRLQGVANDSLAGLNKQVAIYGVSLDGTLASGQKNQAWLQQSIDAYNKVALAQLESGSSLKDVVAGLDKGTDSIKSQTTAAGFLTDQVTAVIKQYQLTPTQIVTRMIADISKATANVAQLQGLIDAVKQHQVPGLTADNAQGKAVIAALQARIDSLTGVTVTAKVDTAAAMQNLKDLENAINSVPGGRSFGMSINNLQSMVGHASGGGVADGYFTSGEAGWELGYKSGSSVSFFNHSQSVALTGMPSRLPGYANGTKAKAPAPIYTVAGIEYGSKMGANNAVFRLLESVLKAADALVDAAGTLSSHADKIGSAVEALTAAAQKAGASSAALSSVAGFQAQLINDASKRDAVAAALGTPPQSIRQTAYDKLAAAQTQFNDARTSVTNSVLGSFDITKAGQLYNDSNTGTAASIASGLLVDVNRAHDFWVALERLHQLGLNGQLLMQLAQAGPDALPQAQALLAGGSRIIREINSDYGNLGAYAVKIGTVSAQAMYGAGVASAQGLVNGLLSQEKTLTAAMTRLGNSIESALKKALRIQSPSRVMHDLGVYTGQGYINGVRSTLNGTSRAGSDLGNAAAHAINGVAGTGGRGDTYLEFHNHFPPGLDEATTATMVARKIGTQVV